MDEQQKLEIAQSNLFVAHQFTSFSAILISFFRQQSRAVQPRERYKSNTTM